jgi:hypothetical protein
MISDPAENLSTSISRAADHSDAVALRRKETVRMKLVSENFKSVPLDNGRMTPRVLVMPFLPYDRLIKRGVWFRITPFFLKGVYGTFFPKAKP